MSDPRRLGIIRGIHTVIYVVMVIAIFAIFYAGVTGARGFWLWTALALVSVEIVVFVGTGMKCPLTEIAVRYGATEGAIFDTFLPEWLTRRTLIIFGPLIAVGLILLSLRR